MRFAGEDFCSPPTLRYGIRYRFRPTRIPFISVDFQTGEDGKHFALSNHFTLHRNRESIMPESTPAVPVPREQHVSSFLRGFGGDAVSRVTIGFYRFGTDPASSHSGNSDSHLKLRQPQVDREKRLHALHVLVKLSVICQDFAINLTHSASTSQRY